MILTEEAKQKIKLDVTQQLINQVEFGIIYNVDEVYSLVLQEIIKKTGSEMPVFTKQALDEGGSVTIGFKCGISIELKETDFVEGN